MDAVQHTSYGATRQWSPVDRHRASWWRNVARHLALHLVVMGLLVSATAHAAQAEEALPPVELPSIEHPEPVVGLLPLGFDIPRLGASAAIVSVGLTEDGAMASPTDPDAVGWFDLGPGVGIAGNALFAGHLDWDGRLRFFSLLYQLEPGDTIRVLAADELWRDYQVQWSRIVEANAPVDDLFAQGDLEEITLITCAGTFDAAAGGYDSRLVVRAARVVQETIAFP